MGLCNFTLSPVHTAEGRTADFLSQGQISSYLKLLISLSYSIYALLIRSKVRMPLLLQSKSLRNTI